MPKKSPNTFGLLSFEPERITKLTPIIARNNIKKNSGFILCLRKNNPIKLTKIGAVLAIKVALATDVNVIDQFQNDMSIAKQNPDRSKIKNKFLFFNKDKFIDLPSIRTHKYKNGKARKAL